MIRYWPSDDSRQDIVGICRLNLLFSEELCKKWRKSMVCPWNSHLRIDLNQLLLEGIDEDGEVTGFVER